MHKPLNPLPSRDMEWLLRQNQLFQGLTAEQMEQVEKFSKWIQLKAGESLFRQGEDAEFLYLVCQGLVKLYRVSPNGQEKIIEIEKPGRVFAEALMFRQMERYPVNAAAMRDSTLIAVSTRRFYALIQQSRDTALQMMADLSERLHQMIAEIEHLSLLNGRMRVATYFLDQYLQRGRSYTLEIPKNAIASLLALQPESFSRLLKELVAHSVIAVDDNKIEILDDQLLREYAGILQASKVNSAV